MEKSLAITSYDEIERAAVAMTKSGYFQDVKDQAQAIVKILAGRELGFGAFASMQNIFIIQGRPSVGANLMASAVKGSPKYDYRVKEHSDAACAIEFYQLTGGKYEPLGVSKFTIEDAKKAQTKNLDKYPRNMLFARAMSNGVRWYCPDVTGGPVYTPEELGAQVDEDGDVIDTTARVVSSTPTQPPTDNGHDEAFEDLPSAAAERPCTLQQRKAIFAIWKSVNGGDEGLRDWLKQHYGTEHTTELTVAQASAIIEALKATEQAQGGAA